MIKPVLLAVALSAIATVSVAQVKALPPAPAPGVSCKATYNPASDKDNYCGCYQQQQKDNCNVLKPPISCDMKPELMVRASYENVASIFHGDLNKFCENEVAQMKKKGKTSITVQNCEDDMSQVFEGEPSQSFCVNNWQS